MKWAETMYWRSVTLTRSGVFRWRYKEVGLVFGPGLRLWPFNWSICLLRREEPLYMPPKPQEIKIHRSTLDYGCIQIEQAGPKKSDVRSVRMTLNGKKVHR